MSPPVREHPLARGKNAFMRMRESGDPLQFRQFQTAGGGDVAGDQHDFIRATFQPARVDQRRQIGACAGNKDRNSGTVSQDE